MSHGRFKNHWGLLLSRNSFHRMLDIAGGFVAAIWRNDSGIAVRST
jgi:hypothetical protein